MTACKHQWIEIPSTRLYKCAHCGTFMRIEK
jgi:hypothetical protein